jgi:hypothetical protein
MSKSLLRLAVVVALVLGLPAPGRAQVAWDVPPLVYPGSPAGMSLFVTAAHPGDGIGVLATWRGSAAPTGIGYRLGIAEEPGGDVAALVGVDVSGGLAAPDGAGSPAVLWWTGAGFGVGDDFLVSFPLGIGLGWEARADEVTFRPSVGGHVVLDVFTGEGDDLDLDGALDLGVDLAFRSGFTVRFGGSLGGREALAIGVRIPSGGER